MLSADVVPPSAGTPKRLPTTVKHRPEGPFPDRPALWAAYKYVVEDLPWHVEVHKLDGLSLSLSGDDRFVHYLSGGADSTFKARSRTAIVQAAAGIAENFTDRSIRLRAGLGPASVVDENMLGMRMRSLLVERLRKIITDGGYEGLLANSIVPDDWDTISSGSSREEPELGPVVLSEADKLLAGLKPNPLPDDLSGPYRHLTDDDARKTIFALDASDKAIRTAINHIFSNSVEWQLVAPLSGMPALSVKGCRRFEDIAHLRKVESEADRARTAVVIAILAVIRRTDGREFRRLTGVDLDAASADPELLASCSVAIRRELLAALTVAALPGRRVELTKLIQDPVAA